MTIIYLLDSWAVLAYLKRESPADKQVTSLLEKAKQGEVRLSISMVNLGEVYYNVGKARGERFADAVLSDLRLLPIDIVQVEEEMVFSAARWKMKYPISYADAFAAATAEQLNATLVTGDPELVSLDSVLKIEKLVRS